MNALQGMINRAMLPLQRGLSMMLARGTIQRVGGGMMQNVQVSLLADEVKDDVEHFEPYGMTAHPLGGSEAVVGFLGGDRSHGIALTITDRRYRPAVAEGEVAVYTHEDQGGGHRLKLLADRKAELIADKVLISADTEIRLKVGGSEIVIGSEGIQIIGSSLVLTKV